MPRSQHSDRYKRFRELLIHERRRRDLTQAEVAQRLKKPQSYVSKYEAGERRLDVIEFLEIAEILGAQPWAILRRLR